MDLETERYLVRRAQEGDPTRLVELFWLERSFFLRVAHYWLRRLGCRDIRGRELVGIVQTTVWHKLQEFDLGRGVRFRKWVARFIEFAAKE